MTGALAAAALAALFSLAASPSAVSAQNSWCDAADQYHGGTTTAGGDLKVRIVREHDPVGSSKNYWINVDRVDTPNRTDLGCVTVSTACDYEQGPPGGGVPPVDACARGNRRGQTVSATVILPSGQQGSFTAKSGFYYELEVEERRDPVTLTGRLVWKGKGRRITKTIYAGDLHGNKQKINVSRGGRFSQRLPQGFRRGEQIGFCFDMHQQSYVQYPSNWPRCGGWTPRCNDPDDCWTIPKDGDLGTISFPLPEIEIDDVDVKWRGSGDRADGRVAVELGGRTIGKDKVENGNAGEIETGVAFRKPKTVDVKFTPSHVPGLAYRKQVRVEPPLDADVEMKITPPELVVSGGVVDKQKKRNRPVKATVTLKAKGRGTVGSATSSKKDGSFQLTVGRWSDPVNHLHVKPDPQLYALGQALHPRKEGRTFWTKQVDALTSAYDDQSPKVVAPGSKATFRMDNLALEVSGDMKPMAVRGRFQWRRERLRDQVGNVSTRRSHGFQDRYPRGQLDVTEYGATKLRRTAGGGFATSSTVTSVGSTRLRPADDGKFRVDFGDFYGRRTVQLFFTPASLPNLTYRSKAINVERGTDVRREISHPKLVLHGSVRDPDGCAVPATVRFYPKIPGNESWHQRIASSSHLSDAGRNLSGVVEHVPVRKVVIEPTESYLQTRTLSGEQWRRLLRRSITAYDPAEPDTVDLSSSRRRTYLVRGLDIELDYVRPTVGPAGLGRDARFGRNPFASGGGGGGDGGDGEDPVERQPDLDRDGVPDVVEQHLADVHTPSYRFDRDQSVLPGDLGSYLRNSRLVTPTKGGGKQGGATSGIAALGGGYFLENSAATPSLGQPGPVYVRVMKLDAASLEDASYRIAYGLWYDRGRHGPHYLPPSAGRAYRGGFKEVLVDVHRGEVQQVFLRNYDHDGAGERTIAGIDFDFAANSYTYGPDGVLRHGYDPLVESDELDRLQWETFGRFEGQRRPQYFRVYVAAGTHNQFVQPGKTFIRPKAVTLEQEDAAEVERALFGTAAFVPQLHRGGGAPAAVRGTASVANRPEIELLGAAPRAGGRFGSGRWTRRSVSKPTAGDVSSSLLTFPGRWGQDSAVVKFSGRKPATVWLSTAGPGPMRYDTTNRLGDAPGGGAAGYRVPEGTLEQAARRARSGGTLFGDGDGGNLGGSAGGDGGSDEPDGPSGGASGGTGHLFAWSGDATFQYVIGTCIDVTGCPFPGRAGRTGTSPGATGPAASDPEIGGEASGYARDYPATGDAYLDVGFHAHAMGEEAKFLRVTSVRQSTGGGGSATTATTIRWKGALRTFNSLPPGTYANLGIVSADVGISLLGFGITTEMSLDANLDRPKVTKKSGATRVARVLDASLGGSWSIVQVGFDPDVPGAPSATLSPIQVKRPDIFRGVLNVKASPSSLSSWVELSANFKAAIGVGSGVGMGGLGLGSGFTYIDLVDYRIADTRFDLLR